MFTLGSHTEHLNTQSTPRVSCGSGCKSHRAARWATDNAKCGVWMEPQSGTHVMHKFGNAIQVMHTKSNRGRHSNRRGGLDDIYKDLT